MLQLRDLGMVPNSTEEFSTEPQALVIRTFPPAGARVDPRRRHVRCLCPRDPRKLMIPKDIAGRTDGEVAPYSDRLGPRS